jgi:hypothetical protein
VPMCDSGGASTLGREMCPSNRLCVFGGRLEDKCCCKSCRSLKEDTFVHLEHLSIPSGSWDIGSHTAHLSVANILCLGPSICFEFFFFGRVSSLACRFGAGDSSFLTMQCSLSLLSFHHQYCDESPLRYYRLRGLVSEGQFLIGWSLHCFGFGFIWNWNRNSPWLFIFLRYHFQHSHTDVV